MSDKTAIIVGAGVAGLAAAWWLDTIGWRSIIIERAPTLRDGGYMIGLSGPGYETARRMGLLPQLEEVSYTINENVYRDRRGREILRLRYREFLVGLSYLALRRTDLMRLVRDGLPPSAALRLGTTVQAIDQRDDGVSATLSDGSRVDGALLIGADGLRSQVRRQVFGDDEQFFESLGYRFATYDLNDDLKLGADFMSYAEPGHLAEFYQLREGSLAGLHIWRDDDSRAIPAGDRWGKLREVAQASNPHVREIMARAAEKTEPMLDSLTLVSMPKWHTGRVLLLGDAAHCLTLVSGQGAGIAMASAEILAQELGRKPVDEALLAHHGRLAPAVARLQDRSRKMARVFVPQSAWGFSLRNAMLRHIPRRWLGRYFLNAIRSEIALVGAVER